MHDRPPEQPPAHVRRRRYAGKNPRQYHEKYKELNSAQYPGEVEKVLAAGKTPAGTHRPIMVDEVLECLRPVGGEVAVGGAAALAGRADARAAGHARSG